MSTPTVCVANNMGNMHSFLCIGSGMLLRSDTRRTGVPKAEHVSRSMLSAHSLRNSSRGPPGFFLSKTGQNYLRKLVYASPRFSLRKLSALRVLCVLGTPRFCAPSPRTLRVRQLSLRNFSNFSAPRAPCKFSVRVSLSKLSAHVSLLKFVQPSFDASFSGQYYLRRCSVQASLHKLALQIYLSASCFAHVGRTRRS